MRRTEKYCVARIGLEVREGFYFFGMLMKTVHPNMRKDDMERGKETDGITLQTPQAGHKRVKRKGNANVYEKPPKTKKSHLN